jgi:hypothetical protein
MSAYDNQSESPELLSHEALTLGERLLRERLGEIRSAISTRNYYRIGEEDKEVVRRESVVRSLEEARQIQKPLSVETTDIVESTPGVVASDRQTVVDLKALENNALRLVEEAYQEAA